MVFEMSGGSHGYLCFKVDEWPLEQGLRALLADIFHSVEWSESCDTNRKDAEKAIYDRLLKYMDEWKE